MAKIRPSDGCGGKAITMAALSYGVVERPFLILRKRLIGGHGLGAPWITMALVSAGALGFAHLFLFTDSVWLLW